jgi:hypothetical protein
LKTRFGHGDSTLHALQAPGYDTGIYACIPLLVSYVRNQCTVQNSAISCLCKYRSLTIPTPYF